MFGRLLQKEFLSYFLDFRFITVFVLCALLSAISVYMGGQNYLRQLGECTATNEAHRRTLLTAIDKRDLDHFQVIGDRWSRRPEVLGPIVYGLSGKLGQEAFVNAQRFPKFEASLFEIDPVYALFGVLDLSFIVEVVLSLCVLLFTYDAVCGEKEGGTLRLCASFPVPRSQTALVKLIGSAMAVLVPFLLAYLMAAVALSLIPEVDLQVKDWLRAGALMVVFALYIVVFAAFGVLASAFTHRRMTAFLALLGLWTLWIFVIPDIAVRTARRLRPVESPVTLQKRAEGLFWEVEQGRNAEVDAYWRTRAVKDWNALSEAQKRELMEGEEKIQERWDATYSSRLARIREERRNEMRRQQRLTAMLSALSPLGAVTFVSTDLARTGFVQQERIEDALDAHLSYLVRFIREKQFQQDPVLTDYSRFAYQDRDTLVECLSRNTLHILNLALLAVLGFAGAYVAILRYDVR